MADTYLIFNIQNRAGREERREAGRGRRKGRGRRGEKGGRGYLVYEKYTNILMLRFGGARGTFSLLFKPFLQATAKKKRKTNK